MIHLANILIASDDAAFCQTLLRMVRGYGYVGDVVSSLNEAMNSTRNEHPDLLLLGPTLTGGTALDLARALRLDPVCQDIPLCLLAAACTPDEKRAALEAGIDDVVTAPWSDDKLLAHLRPLVRIATMYVELQQRAGAAHFMGIAAAAAVPPLALPERCSLLLVGADLPALQAALDGDAVARAADPFVAEALLDDNSFDAAILALPAQTDDSRVQPYLDLCAQLRNNPRLFNLPVVVVSDAAAFDEATAYRHGVSAFFPERFDRDDLRVTVQSLVRRQRLRWAIRQAIAGTQAEAALDQGTTAYSRAFFDRYLADRLDFAARHGRHLALMFFRVPDIEGVRQRFGDEAAAHLRLQVSQWIISLLRGEDLTARTDENEFCVVLPDTPRDEAAIVMHRIAGVLAYTDFAVKDVYQPVKVWVRVGASDYHPGDDVAALVGRAHREMQ